MTASNPQPRTRARVECGALGLLLLSLGSHIAVLQTEPGSPARASQRRGCYAARALAFWYAAAMAVSPFAFALLSMTRSIHSGTSSSGGG